MIASNTQKIDSNRKKRKTKFTILYVDDEQHNLFSFKATFRREYKVLTAESGKEGLEMLQKNIVHLVISDQRMPEMTGVQFLEQTVKLYPETVRIVLTGFSDVEAIIQAINTGRVYRYITKPWDENELRMTINNAQQMYNLQGKNKELVKTLQHKVEEQEKTLRLFMKYVPEAVVQKALSDSEDDIFAGEVRDIAVLFCDIRGFTPMSERLGPKEVVTFLNDYYALMTRCIKRYNGVVNQFVGDEVFGVFGAPLTYPNNEENAVLCAIDMITEIDSLNEIYQKRFNEAIEVGIGINCGEVVAGNLGSEDKIEYSVTGDTVNTGKRIESLSKPYPNSILISEPVFQKVQHLIHVKTWAPVQVQGKREKMIVHQVLGRK